MPHSTKVSRVECAKSIMDESKRFKTDVLHNRRSADKPSEMLIHFSIMFSAIARSVIKTLILGSSVNREDAFTIKFFIKYYTVIKLSAISIQRAIEGDRATSQFKIALKACAAALNMACAISTRSAINLMNQAATSTEHIKNNQNEDHVSGEALLNAFELLNVSGDEILNYAREYERLLPLSDDNRSEKFFSTPGMTVKVIAEGDSFSKIGITSPVAKSIVNHTLTFVTTLGACQQFYLSREDFLYVSLIKTALEGCQMALENKREISDSATLLCERCFFNMEVHLHSWSTTLIKSWADSNDSNPFVHYRFM